MRILALLAAAVGLVFGLAYADPSVQGLEHRNSDFNPSRNGKITVPDALPAAEYKPYSVPDGGNTLALMAIGMAGLAGWNQWARKSC